LVVLCLVLVTVAACSTVSDVTDRLLGGSSDTGMQDGEATGDLPVPGDDDTIPYEVRIDGAEQDDLQDLMEEAALLYRLQAEPPSTILGLRRRLDADLATFVEVLRSEGYYKGTATGEVQREANPVQVVVKIEPGPRYTIDALTIHYRDGPAPPDAPRSLDDVPLKRGAPAEADAILRVIEGLPQALMVRGYPFAKVADTRYTVNHDETVLRADIGMNAGPPARYGAVEIKGLKRVKEDYLQDLVPWQPNEAWNEDKVDEYRTTLLSTGLFRSMQVSHPDDVAEDGTLPITVEAAEAKHRTLGAGAHYSSDQGFGVTAFWEHRNTFGRDEDVRVELGLSQKNQELSTSFLKPAFLHPDQSLVAEATLQNEETEAYERLGLNTGLGVERTFGEYWTLGGGVSLEYSQITESGQEEKDVLLAGLPLSARRDSTDDKLDPTEGSRLGVLLTPYTGTVDSEGLSFVRTEATGSIYYSPLESDRLTLAARVGLGTISGADLDLIPANKRFYTGGGGSVRGFEYQTIGPLDDEGNPTGGRSKLEAGVEARIKVTDSIGVVPFLDAGQVFASQLPNFSREMRYAGGLGVRYYTAIGPVRLDVAAPINPRDNVDDAYQFYISIGQAF
jgi:translocation and assembly module TamA